MELFRFSDCRTGHAGQFIIHAEIVLNGDGGVGQALSLDVDPFLGLDSLMQTFRIAPAQHQAAGKLIYNNDLALIVDHIIAVFFV